MPLPPGSRLGRYEILSALGAGGMGEVYRARDSRLGRVVALKLLPAGLLADQGRRARLEREARILGSLNHPNIATLYGFEEEGEVSFLALELVEGETLAHRLAAGPLLLDELLDIAIQVADGLAEAHAHAVVHRDLKPANIIVDANGRAKVLDFGLARPIPRFVASAGVDANAETYTAELTLEGQVLGTIAYMSPEQATGKEVDSRSDVFSFGVLLYEMAAGVRPFRGESTVSTLAKILEAEPQPLTEKRLPSELGRILRRCLSKKPADRYHDTRDLVVELQQLKRDRFSAASTAWRSRALVPRSGVHVPRWAAVAAGLVVVLLAAVSLYRRADHSPEVGGTSKAEPSARQLTFSGEGSLPAISPDGRLVAYVEGTEGPLRVMVYDVAREQTAEIYRSQESIFDLRWSPTGAELLVRQPLSIAVVPRSGGRARPLLFPAAAAAWSADGSEIAVINTNTEVGSVLSTTTGASRALRYPRPETEWMKDIDWSAERDRLLVETEAKDGSRARLWTMDRNGGDVIDLVDLPQIWSPRWHDGGRSILFASGVRLLRQDLDSDGRPSGEPRALNVEMDPNAHYSVSADGSRVAVDKFVVSSRLRLLTLGDEDRPEEDRELISATAVLGSPALTPDGRFAVFSLGATLHRASVSDGSMETLPYGGNGLGLSPDGTQFVSVEHDGGALRLYVAPLLGGERRWLSHTRPYAQGEVRWTTAGIMYQLVGNQNFVIVDPVTGNERPLLKDDSRGWIFAPIASPAGDLVAVYWNRPTSTPGAWVVSLVTGEEKLLLPGYGSLPVGWSADGKKVFIESSRRFPFSGPSQLLVVDVSGGRAVPVPSGALDEGSVMRVMHDGNTLLVQNTKLSSDVWLIEDFEAQRPARSAGGS